MAEFRLLRGETAFIDDQDAHLVEGHVWHRHSEGYVVRTVGTKYHRKVIWLHRVIAGFRNPDHRDGDKLNNRRSNLRIANAIQNSANKRKTKNVKSSKFKGVIFRSADKKWNKDRWVALIKHKVKTKRQITLGTFNTEIEAACAYNKAAKRVFGSYALLNQI